MFSQQTSTSTMSQKDIKSLLKKRHARDISVTYYEKPSGGHKDVLGTTKWQESLQLKSELSATAQ
jgi:hypothetical protein